LNETTVRRQKVNEYMNYRISSKMGNLTNKQMNLCVSNFVQDQPMHMNVWM